MATNVTFKLFVISGTDVIHSREIRDEERIRILDSSFSLVTIRGKYYSYIKAEAFETTIFIFVTEFTYPTLTL